MKLPTVAGLLSIWPHMTPAAAEMIRSLLRGEDDPRAFFSARDWFATCRHRPTINNPELILRAVSDLADEFGVESVGIDDDGRSVTLTYVLRCSHHVPTLGYDDDSGEYLLISRRDWIEAREDER